MPSPKGMRVVQFATAGAGGAAVHIYSDPQHIWLQLRQNVPTEQSIRIPSFKIALNLTPQQAIAGELLTAATRKPAPPTSPPAKPTQDKKPTQNKQPQNSKQPQKNKPPQAKSPPAKPPAPKTQPPKSHPGKPEKS